MGAKKNLDDAVSMAEAKFEDVNAKESEAAAAAAADRAAIAEEISIEKANTEEKLHAAVATMASSLLALKDVTREAIAKTDTRVDAYAKNMEKEFADISETMKTQMTTLTGKIEAQKESATADIAAADEDAADKFGTLYENMAAQRSELDEDLAASVVDINDSIAKQAALADSRFIKTVKDIEAARREAAGA